jgi:surface protein
MVDIASSIREKTGKEDKIAPVDFAKEIKGISVGAPINNQDKVIDVTENGTIEVMADSDYTGLGKVTINTEVSGGSSKPKWTGHADAEGLKAIGWTDEDIAYYQQYGVNWNEEDDEYHKVTDDNKALYGVLTASNILAYKDRIVYLPKIDTSGVTYMSRMFYNCYSLTAIPLLDTSGVTDMSYMFQNCYSLTAIPQLDTSSVTDMRVMFNNCYSLTAIPQLDTSSVTDMSSMFESCYSLTAIPLLDTSSVTNMSYMFYNCYSLTAIPLLDTSGVTDMSYMFQNCYSLITANLKNVKLAYQLNKSTLLSKESLLYLINNEAATSAITIKLASYAYDKWAADADVVAALANHPNISLAK